jgi:hypothetical protein
MRFQVQNQKGRARRHEVKRDTIDQSIMSTTPAEKMREAGVKARETAEALLRALCEDEASAEGFAVAALKRAKEDEKDDGSSSGLKHRAVFFEAPATAVETLVKVLDVSQKAGAPVEKRVGAIAGRTRLVGVKEVEEAIGCGTPAPTSRRTKRRVRRLSMRRRMGSS